MEKTLFKEKFLDRNIKSRRASWDGIKQFIFFNFLVSSGLYYIQIIRYYFIIRYNTCILITIGFSKFIIWAHYTCMIELDIDTRDFYI